MSAPSSSNPNGAQPEFPLIGGLVPFSSVDFPGRLAAVVFLRGCPWRCSYCHNTHLQARSRDQDDPQWEQIEAFLEARRGLLDAVVFSGGEPLADKHLLYRIQTVKQMGFAAGLHTSGAYPDRFKMVLPSLDWVGFDVKAPFEKYPRITTVSASGDDARHSLDMLLSQGREFECRTTVHPDLHTEDDLKSIARYLASRGVSRYAWQLFRAQGCTNLNLIQRQRADFPSQELRHEVQQLFSSFEIRLSH